jgi:PAS domain-containing protein
MLTILDQPRPDTGAAGPPRHRGVETHFAPAGRCPRDELLRAAAVLQSAPVLSATINAMPIAVVVLNRQRQVVMANQLLLDLLGRDSAGVLGQRPGELLGCVKAHYGPDGCGTAQHCAHCGAVAAFLDCQESRAQVTREYCLNRACGQGNSAAELLVTASPIAMGDCDFTLVSLQEISQQKRLGVLMRTFFHDVLNTAGCIQGYAQCLAADAGGSPGQSDDVARLAALADQLIEEIQGQRDLLAAESGELLPQWQTVEPVPLVRNLCDAYARHPAGLGKHIAMRCAWHGELETDPRLLRRVLGNMLKNALEATTAGGVATLHCQLDSDRLVFDVHNAAVMPADVQMQVFQRSFSTKGQPGRGIGTHSIKLLGERYLGGKVSFVSAEPDGTTFTLSLPLRRKA